MPKIEDALPGYRCFSIRAAPADFLSGDADKREAEIVLVGKKDDDLNGAVKRRLLADMNRYFWEHPRDADDTRLVFEAIEKGARYDENGSGTARLALIISIGLAASRPDFCCRC